MCQQIPPLPWLPTHGFLLEITLHVRFYSDLFTAARHAGKEGAFSTAVMGHSEWQDWEIQDVCVWLLPDTLTARELLPLPAPEQDICESAALGSVQQERGQQQISAGNQRP